MEMNNWFECKIKYEKTLDNGMNKKVTEPYLIDALSFTEAEARIIEEMAPFISGEFTVAGIKCSSYAELFFSEEEAADTWYKSKVSFISIDEKSGAEKKTSVQILVQAADIRDAVNKIDENMKDCMSDYEIVSIAETPLIGVYRYEGGTSDSTAPSASVLSFVSGMPTGQPVEMTVGGRQIILEKTVGGTHVSHAGE